MRPLALLLPSLIAACTTEPAQQPSAPAGGEASPPVEAAPATGPSVVLITLDTTRADRMGAYGYERAETPAFDGLAAQGVRFERAYAVTPLTTPSHASMLTGLYPPQHGIRNNGDGILPDSATTLAEALEARGYQTAASVSAFVTTRVWNLDQGFDQYYDEVHASGPAAKWGQERPANEVVDDLVRWLDEERKDDGAFFLWAHFYDPHHPYAPPEGYAERFEDPYDGEIAFVDAQIARLRDRVEAAAGPGGVIWVVLADHGEAFNGEHDEFQHGLYVFDPTMRVPFVIRPAQPLAEGRVVSDVTVSGVDVTPTVLGMLGLPGIDGVQGKDLTGLLSGGELDRGPVYMEATSAQARFGYHPELAAAEGPLKLIDTPSARLFDVVADPGELHNLLGTRPEEEARLRAMVESTFVPVGDGTGAVAPEVMEQLAALGYVSTDFQHDASLNEIDVKDKAAVIARLEGLRSRLAPPRDAEPRTGAEGEPAAPPERSGPTPERLAQLDAVEAEYRALIAEEPTLAEARTGLARILSMRGRKLDAEVVLREALERQPASTVVRAALANNLAGQGRHDEGLQMMLSILERVPGDGTAQVGALRMLTDLKRYDEGITLARQWLADKPDDPALQAQLGILLARKMQLDEAQALLEASLKDEIPRQLVHRTLANIYKVKDKPVMALQQFRKEQRYFPGQNDLWRETGMLLMKQRRWADAAQDLERYAKAEPDDVLGTLAWAQAVFNLGDYTKAESILAPAIQAQPDNPDLLMLQANVLAKLDRREEGQALAARANELKAKQVETMKAASEARRAERQGAPGGSAAGEGAAGEGAAGEGGGAAAGD